MPAWIKHRLIDTITSETPGSSIYTMKKALLFLLLTTAVLAGVIYFTAGRRQGWVEYADGSRARLLKAHGGAHEPPPLLGQPWSRLAQKLPAKPWASTVRDSVGGTLNGESRSWYHVPVETNGLYLWLQLRDGPTPQAQTGSTGLAGAIRDAESWLWFDYGKANANGTLFGDRIDVFGLDFSGFPRWQQWLKVQILRERNEPSVLGVHATKNPGYLTTALTNWISQPLPQTIVQDALTVRLDELTIQPAYRKDLGKLLGGELIPAIKPKVTVMEQQASFGIDGMWHVVRNSFYDNFGNNSYHGLPPRRPGSAVVPPIQWRIAVELVGDHRSRVASNAFVTLPAGPFPALGEHRSIAGDEQRVGDVSVVEVNLLGPGSAAFSKLAMITNQPPGAAFSEGVSRSFSVTDDGQGNRVETLTLSSASPFLVASLKGALSGLWFSCRAENVRSGEVRWLGTYGSPATAPRFERVFDDRGHVWFSCQQLATNEHWNFTFGIHQSREVNFFIDRPEYTKTE